MLTKIRKYVRSNPTRIGDALRDLVLIAILLAHFVVYGLGSKYIYDETGSLAEAILSAALLFFGGLPLVVKLYEEADFWIWDLIDSKIERKLEDDEPESA